MENSNSRHFGRPYRVSGAYSETGEDVELIIQGFNVSDASRAANRKGVLVAGCVPVGGDGAAWAAAPAAALAAPAATPPVKTLVQVLADDTVVQRLLKDFPSLGPGLKRLNKSDQGQLCDLVRVSDRITYREAEHVAHLIRDNRHLPQA